MRNDLLPLACTAKSKPPFRAELNEDNPETQEKK